MLRIILAVVFSQLAIVHASYATSVFYVQVNAVNIVDVDGTPNVIVKVAGGVPSISCSDQTAFVRVLNDNIGKYLYTQALTALTTQKAVDIIGLNSCGSFNVETMGEIRIYP